MKAVNLLPPDLRSGPAAAQLSAGAERASGLGAFALLGTLAVAVIALAAHVLAANAVKQHEAELAAISSQADQVSRQVSALKPYADYAAVTQTRVKTVKDLAGDRFDWDRALRDLSRAVPAEVTLAELDATRSSTVGGAGGASELRGDLDVPAVELQGCATGQTDVARLMSHLRTVSGVTRVSLDTSDKDQPTQRPAVADSGGSGTTAAADSSAGDACGKGDHPTFDILAFFEDSGTAGGAGSADASTGSAAPSGTSTAGGATSTTTSTTTSTSATGAP
jgi:Tfp pilus assembly protein PilN